MVKVVNKYRSAFDIYIGRGSKWGNPYVMQNKSDEERARVIAAYRVHLHNQILSGEVTREDLLELQGQTLGCFCSPKPCHGDVIAQAVAFAENSVSWDSMYNKGS